MTVEPAALRAIADELEAAQRAAETEAIEQLTALVNGAADYAFSIPAGAVRAESDAGLPRPESAGSTPAPRSTPTKPRPLAPPGSNPFQETRPCPECGVQLKRQGFAPHLSKKHGIRGRNWNAFGPGPAGTRPLRAHSYLCPTCSKPFAKLTDLDAHKLTHPQPAKGRPVGEPAAVGFPGGRPD